MPGRKTDVKDAEWLAELLQHGLLKASFIPERGHRELRELVRYRRSLVEQRATVVQRVQKLLEGANIKLSDVTSDVMGVSGRSMLKSLAAGKTDAAELAELAKTALRSKIPQLERALTGSIGNHQRFMLQSQFRLLESLEAEIATLDQEVAERMRPFQAALSRLDEIPGIGHRAAPERNSLRLLGPHLPRQQRVRGQAQARWYWRWQPLAARRPDGGFLVGHPLPPLQFLHRPLPPHRRPAR